MVRAAAVPCALLALCQRWAGALRDADVLASFACPAECQECCVENWALGLLASGEQFKCVLRDSNVRPEGRTCAESERRWHSRSQWKTTCAFTPEEVESKAWEGLEGKCSQQTKCCCSLEEDWTERICMGMDTEAPHVFDVSPKSQASEKYERLPQQYDNENSDCAPEQDRVPESVQYQTGKRSAFTGKGCCLKTEKRTTRESYSCGTQCTGGAPRICHPKTCHRSVEWVGCASWQRLYHCTGDGGVTQTGQLYQRVSSKPGMCLGDRSTPQRLAHANGVTPGSTAAAALEGLTLQDGRCPASYGARVAGVLCKCEAQCGDLPPR